MDEALEKMEKKYSVSWSNGNSYSDGTYNYKDARAVVRGNVSSVTERWTIREIDTDWRMTGVGRRVPYKFLAD